VGEKALYRLLAWRRGSFAFHEQRWRASAARSSGRRAALCASGAAGRGVAAQRRRSARAERARGAEGARSVAPSVLHPLTQEVLLVLELSTRVSEVLDRCSFPDYKCCGRSRR